MQFFESFSCIHKWPLCFNTKYLVKQDLHFHDEGDLNGLRFPKYHWYFIL